MKRVICALLAAMLLVSMVACDSSKEAAGEESKKETQAIQGETTMSEVVTSAKEETTVSEVETSESAAETTEIETETTVSDTEDTSAETETSATATESSETETTETETETVEEVAYPVDGATIVLANDEVYGWSSDYRYTKTDSSPYYRHEDIYYPIPVVFTWKEVADADYYRVYLSTTEDFAESESYLINDNTLSLDHLFVGTKYYWTVIATQMVDGEEVNSYAVAPRSFTTELTPRCLRIEGVSNTRDIGGLECKDGYRIKQGMIYRGGKLEDMTEEGKEYFRNYIGITTDLDLRTPGEGGAGTVSPLGSDIKYVNIDGRYYVGSKGISNDLGKELFAQEIRLFADPDNYPIYIHCSLGRDRTGTLVFVIEALLGVTKLDLYMDYELSVFSVTGTLDNASIPAIRNNIESTYNYINDNYSGASFSEKTENYLLSIGITPEEIQTIRDLLLEEVK